MAKAQKFEYYIKRLGPTKFEVAKFEDFGGDQPLNVYLIEYNAATGKGKCDCPAGMYRNLGPDDKHVKMVAAWVANGDSFQPKSST